MYLIDQHCWIVEHQIDSLIASIVVGAVEIVVLLGGSALDCIVGVTVEHGV